MSEKGQRFLRFLDDKAKQGYAESYHPPKDHPSVVFLKIRTNSSVEKMTFREIDLAKLVGCKR